MEGAKHVVDITAAGAAMLSVLHALPEVLAGVASFLTIVWYTIRLSEWVAKRREK